MDVGGRWRWKPALPFEDGDTSGSEASCCSDSEGDAALEDGWQEEVDEEDTKEATAERRALEELPDPMDEDTYRRVLVDLGKYQWCEPQSRDDFSEEQLKLRQDMTMNKVVWTGRRRQDLWHFMRNINPVLSIFCSHPLHPIKRWKRFLVYAVSFFPITVQAFASEQLSDCIACDLLHCPSSRPLTVRWLEHPFATLHASAGPIYPGVQCAHNLQEQTRDLQSRMVLDPLLNWELPSFCCWVERLGIRWFYDAFRYGDLNLGTPLYAMVVNMLFSVVSFQLMMMGCVQRQPRRWRVLGERLGLGVFCLFSALFIIRSARLLYFIAVQGQLLRMLRIFLLLRLGSCTGATLVNLASFKLLFWAQQKKEPGSRFAWLDPPDRGNDQRSFLAKMLSPRFNVLASEYSQFASRCRRTSPPPDTGASPASTAGRGAAAARLAP